MVWYRVDMTMESLRDGVFHRLCREFQQAFIANGAPLEMALYAQAEPSDGTRRVYFTPGCTTYVQTLIDGYGGTPCNVPDESALTLVFGVPGAEAVVFVAGGDGVAVGDFPYSNGVTHIPGAETEQGTPRHLK
ncbi:MAG TPA: hypothetical protein VF190_16115 [Rhodothermales bacterium]